MKKLPIGIQSFTDIREGSYLYVDKTAAIYRMISFGKTYLLSRPCRFGKSLLVSTLEALFCGKKSLFEGLYIYDKWDWTRSNPVVRIDWTLIGHATAKELEENLTAYLENIAAGYQLTLDREYVLGAFVDLIRQLHEKTGKRVVVLVDGYDVPVLDAVGAASGELDEICDALYRLYSALQGSDEHLHLVLFTGLSKVAGITLALALDTLNDITLDERYADICGYTQQELEDSFSEYLAEEPKNPSEAGEEPLAAIRRWYDGYSWDGKTSVYNPHSILLFLQEKKIRTFWCATGAPAFLIDLLKARADVSFLLQPIRAWANLFGVYNPEHIEVLPLLFQAGYLTIKEVALNGWEREYTLAPPNKVVEESLVRNLMMSYADLYLDEAVRLRESMIREVKACNAAGLEQSLRAMLAHVPCPLRADTEPYYHALLQVWLYFIDFKVKGETSADAGRIYAVGRLPGMAVIARIKYSAEQTLASLIGEPAAQPNDNRQYEAYAAKKIILLTAAFTKNEIGCRIEQLAGYSGSPVE